MDKPPDDESPEIERTEPAPVADPQVVRLSASAIELRLAIRRANALPPAFPEEELVALAEALEEAPGAAVDARLMAAVYVRERFVDCRRLVSEAPDDPELPSIDAIAHCLNDTIAELSTLVIAAGHEAEQRAQPDRTSGTSVVPSEAAGGDLVELQRRPQDTSNHIRDLKTMLQSTPVSLHIDHSRHFHFLNFSVSVERLKLPVKLIGAIFKGEFINSSWLDKLLAVLNKARATFSAAWQVARGFLEQVRSVVDAVQRVSRDLDDLIDSARRVLRRITRNYPPGTVFRDIDASWCPEMVIIPAGSFVMGSPPNEKGRGNNEGPQHRVTFPAPFALGKYPVTFAEYDHFCAETGREKPPDQKWGRGRRPVINVSWDDATAYCTWLSQQTSQAYRLPSEAEWEYACRAGTTTPFWTGATISTEQANYLGDRTYGSGHKGEYREQTTPVDTFEANPWGLHDMHGNVWEWCEDCWSNSYRGAPNDGSAWLQGNCSERVQRGGCWLSEPDFLRSALRISSGAGSWHFQHGFRVSRMPTP